MANPRKSFPVDLLLAALLVLVVFAYFFGPVTWRLLTPGRVACDAATSVAGWKSCRVESHEVWGVQLRSGCSKGDRQAFVISGQNAAGNPAAAVVCCGTFWKTCTLRASR